MSEMMPNGVKTQSTRRLEELYETLTKKDAMEYARLLKEYDNYKGVREGLEWNKWRNRSEEWKKKNKEILSLMREMLEEICTLTAEQKKTRFLKDDAEPVKQDDELMVQGISESQRSKKKDEEGQEDEEKNKTKKKAKKDEGQDEERRKRKALKRVRKRSRSKHGDVEKDYKKRSKLKAESASPESICDADL